ncbi:hypothetical protein AB0F81_46250 [Actinoplanes sp. NPDC024001]|uniref:hypothetical protein n=1 Tax=Actinoplanes sp. NPDC024001 TaxID=3154598 RepID=UPI0033FDCAB2
MPSLISARRRARHTLATAVAAPAVPPGAGSGSSWRRVPVTPAATGWAATRTAPRSGLVSLPAAARDTAGDAVRQEITRAYGSRP